MTHITGIGGIFFRATKPDVLTEWYRRHLGIDMAAPPWQQQAGPTVFAAFKADTDYFPRDHQYMLNLRVDGIAELIADLERAGIEVETRAEWDGEYGIFARIHDPEGNPIELWQRPAEST